MSLHAPAAAGRAIDRLRRPAVLRDPRATARTIAISWWPPIAVVAFAAVLRLSNFAAVKPNPYYDAAVRSMSGSWHNFLFGAYEPGGSVSIDKPPLDLWLQVLSVKLFGFNSTGLRLPIVLAGIASVALLYVVLRPAGRPAALIGSLALAVLPIAVITDRSDTMDSVMVAMDLAAVALVIRSWRSKTILPLLGAAAMLGLAFNVKLFEALLVIPALVALYWLGSDAPRLSRLGALTAAGACFLAVAVSWLAFASLAPGPKPFAIGSSNGSVWQSTFVFNGTARASSKLNADPRDLPGLTRLVRPGGRGYQALVGTEIIAALALGVAAAVAALGGALAVLDGRRVGAPDRGRRALAIAFVIWLVTAGAVLSTMKQLHPRYVEAIAPAVAGCLGLAIGGLARRGWSAARGTVPRLAVAGVTAALVVALLIAPLGSSLRLVRTSASNSGRPGAMSPKVLKRLSRYLGPRTRGVRYEAAFASAIPAGPLIGRDNRPVLVLTTVRKTQVVSAKKLAAAVRKGEVRYAVVPRSTARCTKPSKRFACSGSVGWARRNGKDVSRAAGMPKKLQLLHLRVRQKR